MTNITLLFDVVSLYHFNTGPKDLIHPPRKLFVRKLKRSKIYKILLNGCDKYCTNCMASLYSPQTPLQYFT